MRERERKKERKKEGNFLERVNFSVSAFAYPAGSSLLWR